MKWLTDLLKKLFVDWWKKQKVDPVVKPEAQPAQDEFVGAVLHTCPDEVHGWPVVSGLNVTRSGGDYSFDTDKRELWPNIDGCCGNIVCLLFRDGTWHAAPCDGFRPFPSRRSASCFCVCDGDKRTFEPVSGEKVGMMVTGFCRNGNRMKPKQRTRIAWMVWP
jgi:hypothetical protein